jgi:hypothetical protein
MAGRSVTVEVWPPFRPQRVFQAGNLGIRKFRQIAVRLGNAQQPPVYLGIIALHRLLMGLVGPGEVIFPAFEHGHAAFHP